MSTSGDELIKIEEPDNDYSDTETLSISPASSRKSSSKHSSSRLLSRDLSKRRKTISLSVPAHHNNSHSNFLAPPSLISSASLININGSTSAGSSTSAGLEESHYEEQKVPIIPPVIPVVSSFGAGLTRSKSVKSIRSKSFNYGRKPSNLEVQPKFVALPKHHQSPINGHHSNTNNDPSKAVAEWMEATKGDLVFNALIQKSLEDVTSLYFTPSQFFFQFHKNRGTTELEAPEWQNCGSGQDRKRDVSYRLKTNIPVGPKTSLVKEIQTERASSKTGVIYLTDIEATNHGFPYANTFTIFSHVCAYRETNTSCRLMIKLEIVYKKDVWGYIKGQIESNTVNGTKGFYTDVCDALNKHGKESDQNLEQHQIAISDGDQTKVRARNKAGKKNLSKLVEQDGDKMQINFRGVLFLLILLMLFIMCVVNVIILTNIFLTKSSNNYQDDILKGVNEYPSIDQLLSIVDSDQKNSDQQYLDLFLKHMNQQPQVRKELVNSLTLMISSLKQTEQMLMKAGAIFRQSTEAENSESIEFLLRKIAESKQNNVNS